MTKPPDVQKRREDWHPFDNPLGRIRLILLLLWDPVGVFEYRGSMDEYDFYALQVYQMGMVHSTREEVTDYLRLVEARQMGRKIRSDEPHYVMMLDKLFRVFDDIDEDGSKPAAWEKQNREALQKLELPWFEICEYLEEDQWVLVEAIHSHTEGEKRILDLLTFIDTFPDAAQAQDQCARLKRDSPERDLYIANTSQQNPEIAEGVRFSPWPEYSD